MPAPVLRLPALGLLALLLAAPAAAELPDLVGTWHVLVHYKDKGTPNSDTPRWEDRVWRFSMDGDRLLWEDYPIVVFDDQTGRFEPGPGGRMSRVLAYWEPNANQRREIAEGLAINQRGSRTKTLRGSAAKGWTSARRKRGYSSARFITFEETWSIETKGGLPVFIRDDVLGNAATESMEGRTLYATEAIEEGGDVLRGVFDRDDGTRHGTFRMTRAGTAKAVGRDRKRRREAGVEDFYRIWASSLDKLPGDVPESWYRERVEAGTITSEDRFALRAAFEEALQSTLQSDDDRRAFYVVVTNLARKMERLFVEEGRSVADLQKMLRSGELRP